MHRANDTGHNEPIYILGIESSCDDTSAAVSEDSKIRANIIANQKIHENYGGVVPGICIPCTSEKHCTCS